MHIADEEEGDQDDECEEGTASDKDDEDEGDEDDDEGEEVDEDEGEKGIEQEADDIIEQEESEHATAAGDKRTGLPPQRVRSAADEDRQTAGQLATTSGRSAERELPFTISAPGSYEEFVRLVEGRPASELSMAVQRIRDCNAVALASKNRRKLQVCCPFPA